jgi:2'-hydroxyisoflavone reductase
VRILVIGGTKFVGRAFVEQAAVRHDVTVFHRGSSEPEGFPDVEHVHGDRHGDLGLLRGGSWNAVLDTCAYFPRAVRDVAVALGDAVDHYTFVSTLSVHPDDLAPGATEESPTHQPPFPDTEEVTFETYGPLKAASEAAARDVFAGQSLVVRPGYIVGPHDPTDRFTYWTRRAADGGELLAPGPPDAPFQVVDVRDLAAFMLDRIEVRDTDTYGVVGPGAPITTSDVLETARAAAGADTTLTWVDEDFLHGLGEDIEAALPMWHPQYPGAHSYDPAKAVAAGLGHRPFAETVGDTLAWDRSRGRPELRAGLSRDRERELLERWRAER